LFGVVTGLAALCAMMNIAHLNAGTTSECFGLTVIGGRLFASMRVLSIFLLADCLYALASLVVIAGLADNVNLWMQRGLWGLGSSGRQLEETQSSQQ
jgi:hypothetical protein